MQRIIWIFWDKGLAAAPDVVHQCVKSWRHFNPDWDVRVLDSETVPEFADVHAGFGVIADRLPRSSLANLVRLMLLEQFGGVWVDATCLCVMSLDRWLIKALAPEGMFVFSHPTPDRLVANYFMASKKGAPMLAAWSEDAKRLWRPWPDRDVISAGDTRLSLEAREKTGPVALEDRHYTQPIPLPYFWMHCSYARLVATDPAFASHAAKMTKLNAGPTLLFAQLGYENPITDKVRVAFYAGYAPFYKLDWRPKSMGPAVKFILDEKNWPPRDRAAN